MVDPQFLGDGLQDARPQRQDRGPAGAACPGNFSRWRRSSWASWSASSATWATDSSTWLTPHPLAPAYRCVFAMASRARARAVPPLNIVPPGHPGVLEQVGHRSFPVLRDPLAYLLAHLTVEALPHPQLTLEPRSPHRCAGGRIDVVAVADGQLETPAPEVDAQGRDLARRRRRLSARRSRAGPPAARRAPEWALPRARSRDATTSGPLAASRRAAVASGTTTSGLARSSARRKDLAAAIDAFSLSRGDPARRTHLEAQVEQGLAFSTGLRL